MLRIGEVSKLTGISKRALQLYDDEGLLKPARTGAGYRLYTDEDLLTLVLIKLCRDLGYGLDDIKLILKEPEFDVKTSLDAQIAMLEQRKQALERQIMLAKEVRHLASGEDGPNVGEAMCALLRHPEYAWILSSSGDDDSNEANAYFRWLSESFKRIEECDPNELNESYEQMLEESKDFGISTQVYANLAAQLATLKEEGVSASSDEATKFVEIAYKVLDEAYDADPFISLYLIGMHYGNGELTPPSLLATMDEEMQSEIAELQAYMAEAVKTYIGTLELNDDRKQAIKDISN